MPDFTIKLPVRWGDMDSFGHVSNVVYLRFLEDVRAQWMESVPCHWQDGETGPVVANININYRRPLYWPGEVEVTLKPRSPGRSSIKLEHQVLGVVADGKAEPLLFADATCTLVWIDKKSGEPVPLPTSIRDLAEA